MPGETMATAAPARTRTWPGSSRKPLTTWPSSSRRASVRKQAGRASVPGSPGTPKSPPGPARSNYPQLTRTDYVADSNNSPRYVNPAAPLTGYAPVYDTRAPLELRPRLSLDMISQRVAGTDGYGPPGFTMSSLQETMFGQRNYSADLARTAVVAMCQAHPVLTASDGKQVDVSAACSVLNAWNGRADTDSRGEVLWQQAYGGIDYTPDWWSVPFNPSQSNTVTVQAISEMTQAVFPSGLNVTCLGPEPGGSVINGRSPGVRAALVGLT